MAYVRNPVVYVPDLTNGRPIVDGKVYLLTAGTVPPTQDSSINPANLLTVSYVNEAGNTVTQPQPLYTSKGGCLYGSFPEEARQYMIAPQGYVFAAYDKIGRLQYSAETTVSDYVETDALAAVGSTVLVGGVEANDLARKYSEAVSVKDFGAKGDGATDDTAAIVAAINTAKSNYKPVWFPVGTYLFSQTLVLGGNVKLFGDGFGVSVLKHTGSGIAVRFTDVAFPSYVSNVRMEGLMVYGNANTTTGIDARNASDSGVSHVKVMNCITGMYAEYGWNNDAYFFHAVLNRGDGVRFGFEANQWTMTACSIYLNGGSGLAAINPRILSCRGCTFEGNTQYGVYISSETGGPAGTRAVTIQDSYIEGNGIFEMLIQGGGGGQVPRGINIKGNYFARLSGKAGTCIRIVDGIGINIEGNFYDVGSATYDFSTYASGGSSIKYTDDNVDLSTNKAVFEPGALFERTNSNTVKAHATFLGNGATGAITPSTSYGVTSIVKESTGVYLVTLKEPMASNNFPVSVQSENGSSFICQIANVIPVSSTSFRIRIHGQYGGSDTFAVADGREISLAVLGTRL